jgi:hypothetical protein
MRLKFDGRLYSRQAVDMAIEAFSDLARFKVTESAGIINVELKGADVDAEVGDEFSNFVLSGMSK